MSYKQTQKVHWDKVKGRVSVIIPTFNYGHFILDALNSVLKQDFPDMEIIIVDDGSEDDTKNILNEYKNAIKYIYQMNSGLSYARNTGIKNSTGEFILFLDADDLLGEQLLKKQVNFLNKNKNISISVCKNKLFSAISEKGKPTVEGKWKLYHNFLDIHLCYLNIAPPHAFMCRRKVIHDIGLFDTSLKACEDWDYWIRAVFAGHIPFFNSAGTVYYRKHAESMSSNLLNQRRHDIILHNRIDKLLENSRHLSAKQRVEGLLALSAGAVFTASRAESLGPDVVTALLELALENVRSALDICKSIQDNCSLLINFFCIKTINNLNKLLNIDQNLALSIHKTIKRILRINNNTQRLLFPIIQKSLLTILRESYIESYETVALALKTRLKHKNRHLCHVKYKT